MNRALLSGATALALLMAASAPSPAQTQICKDEESVPACVQRAVQEARAANAAARVHTKLTGAATGPNVGGQAASAMRDFLPAFAASLLSPAVADEKPAIDARLNVPLRNATRTLGLTGQLGLTLHPAELFPTLKDSLADTPGLEEELEDGDDVTLFAAANLETASYGRSFASHAPTADRIAAQVISRHAAGLRFDPDALTERIDNLLATMTVDSIHPDHKDNPTCTAAFRGGTFAQSSALSMLCLRDSDRNTVEALVAPAVRAAAERQDAIADGVRAVGLDRLAQLVNNQPQLSVAGEYRTRQALAGPSEWSVRARWERGSANMNGLRGRCGALPDATCFREYVRDSTVQRSLDRGARWWLSGDFSRRRTFWFDSEADSLHLRLNGVSVLAASAGYGRYVGSAKEGLERNRVDLSARYEHSLDAGLLESRAVASAFFTLRLNDDAQGLIGLVWSSEPDLLDSADRRLRANLGISYKISRKSDDGS